MRSTAEQRTYPFVVYRAMANGDRGPLLSRHRKLELAANAVQLHGCPCVVIGADGQPVSVAPIDHTSRACLNQQQQLKLLPLAFFEAHGLDHRDLDRVYVRFQTRHMAIGFRADTGFATATFMGGKNTFVLLPWTEAKQHLLKAAIRRGATIVDFKRQLPLLRMIIGNDQIPNALKSCKTK